MAIHKKSSTSKSRGKIRPTSESENGIIGTGTGDTNTPTQKGEFTDILDQLRNLSKKKKQRGGIPNGTVGGFGMGEMNINNINNKSVLDAGKGILGNRASSNPRSSMGNRPGEGFLGATNKGILPNPSKPNKRSNSNFTRSAELKNIGGITGQGSSNNSNHSNNSNNSNNSYKIFNESYTQGQPRGLSNERIGGPINNPQHPTTPKINRPELPDHKGAVALLKPYIIQKERPRSKSKNSCMCIYIYIYIYIYSPGEKTKQQREIPESRGGVPTVTTNPAPSPITTSGEQARKTGVHDIKGDKQPFRDSGISTEGKHRNIWLP